MQYSIFSEEMAVYIFTYRNHILSVATLYLIITYLIGYEKILQMHFMDSSSKIANSSCSALQIKLHRIVTVGLRHSSLKMEQTE
uniref:Uncharacterized protein n=1 Tax=Anguilla anguilla TaxID=7936 RepID=A0A0E9XXJ7_ANGAN